MLSAGAGALGLTACTSAVVVESEFPTPLIETLPVSVGLFYEDQLRDFIHVEALPRSATWTIDLGDANIAMLNPVFGTMFRTTRELDSLPPTPADAAVVDAVLSSSIDQFQFDVPRSTRDEFVEVWLQYRIQLLDADGGLIIDWEVPGYGKAEVDSTREDAVHRAAIIAMREAGARIATEFTQQQPVQDWLEDVQNAI